ncbi:hypothetical protein JZX87_09960 [Agrobacterium sp. Ap1]|uniref:hypothetical protein n=1 Tax=Agrobacterium sp. Ap1 TaxID=2815337 RepID=UPI001A8C72FB|nr:hypothetical protein [Agrobacterium sp. Ap1]MBO0141486.1 hypothetical protein [Agrobacterium sp. Ap1]
MNYPPSIAKTKAIEEYSKVLSAVPSCGLRRAMTKLKHGQYENINLDFIPTPANLAAMARAEAKVTIDDLTRLREKQATLRDLHDKPEPVSEEARARVRSMLGRFNANHEAHKAQQRGYVAPEPMSDEKAEYWRKIEAMKDAPEVTDEHQQFRNKINMETPEDRQEAAQ